VRELTLVNIKYEGSNIWVPGPIVVKKGEHVKLRLINNVPGDPAEHGLAIKEFGVEKVVKRGHPETVEFTADRAGIFRTFCHMHVPHVGTQLVVLD
jgi:nitrosocyanin